MAPIEPTARSFSRYGVTDFKAEYWTGTAWAAVPGGTCAAIECMEADSSPGDDDGHTRGHHRHDGRLEPARGSRSVQRRNRTHHLRRLSLRSCQYGADVEWRVATASSTYSSNYPSSTDQRQQKGRALGQWAAGGTTPPRHSPIGFASILQERKRSMKSVSSRAGQLYGSDGTHAALTFTRYGLTTFQLEYWTGTAWAAIPGGSVDGNRRLAEVQLYSGHHHRDPSLHHRIHGWMESNDGSRGYAAANDLANARH